MSCQYDHKGNINVACHNIGNFAAKIRDPDYVQFIHSFDIFGVVETFTRETFDFNMHFKDYVAYHAPAIKLSLRGRVSGGVAVLVHKRLANFVTHVKTVFDHMVC